MSNSLDPQSDLLPRLSADIMGKLVFMFVRLLVLGCTSRSTIFQSFCDSFLGLTSTKQSRTLHCAPGEDRTRNLKLVFSLYVNNKGADQPLHLHVYNLISTFVFCA